MHDLQLLVSKLKDLGVEIPESFQVGAISKLLPSWNDYQKKLLHTIESFLVDQMLKHPRIEEDARILQEKELASSPKVNYVDQRKNYNNGQESKKRKSSRQNTISAKDKKESDMLQLWQEGAF